MYGKQNGAIKPRCHRIIVSPILSAGLALQHKAIARAIFLRRREFLILPEKLVLEHVFIREVRSHEWIVPMFKRQGASSFLTRKHRVNGHVPTRAHLQKKDGLLRARP